MIEVDASTWTQTRESGFRWQFRLMRWLGLNVSPWLVAPLLWVVVSCFVLQARRPTTRASRLFLGRVFGRRPRFGELHRHSLNFAHVFFDRVRLLANGLAGFRIEVSGQQLIEQALAEGKGGVLLGAHFGSFEVLRAYDRLLPALKVNYLMYPEHAPDSTALLNELNASVAERIISLQDSRLAMLQVYEALDRGEFVAFLGDRFARQNVRGQIAVPFLGEPVRLPTAPYLAALAAKVPLFFCSAPRLGMNHYAIEFSMLHDGSPVGRSERSAQIEALGRRYAEALEDCCRRSPYNWFNFYDVWRQ